MPYLHRFSFSHIRSITRRPTPSRPVAAVEAMEMRLLLSNSPIVVNTAADQTDPVGSQVVSLRDAVNLANSRGGAESITFDPAVFPAESFTVITLKEGPLTFLDSTGQTTIDGLGRIAINGSGEVTDVIVDSGASVSLQHLNTIAGRDLSTAMTGGDADNAGTLAMAHCNVSSGSAPMGGGVYNTGSLSLLDCTVENNQAGEGGGGIDVAAGSATITGCTFTGNSAQDEGGGISDYGGAITLSNSTLKQNSAGSGGGVSIANATASPAISGCTINANTSSSDGGGVESVGGPSLAVNNTTISGNTAKGSGGGIYGDAVVTNSTISYNSAHLDGGGIYAYEATISHSAVNDNTSSAASDGQGGGIYVSAEFGADHSTINANSAYDGGGVYASDESAVTSYVSDCTLAGNKANDAGGGMYVEPNVVAKGCNISNNTATAQGGGTYSKFGTLTLNYCTLSANSTVGSGGGIYDQIGTDNVTDSTVEGNSAVFGGGAFTEDGFLNFTSSTINKNVTISSGGGIDNQYGALTLTQSTVSNNSAATAGGGIASGGDQCNITNSTITGNTLSQSGSYGGGVAVTAGIAEITYATVDRNTASSGAGIALRGQAIAVIATSIVAGNTTQPLGKGAPADISGVVSSSNNDHDLIGDGSGGFSKAASAHNLVGSASHPLNPLLAPLGNYGGPTQTQALLPGSPALDAGPAFSDPEGLVTDQRGVVRPQGPAADIGAFESRRLYGYGATFHATRAVTFDGYVGAFGDDNPLDTSPSDFKITIAWGDGSSSSGTVKYNSSTGIWDLSGSHRYAKTGTYAVSIAIRDSGGFATTVHSTGNVA